MRLLSAPRASPTGHVLVGEPIAPEQLIIVRAHHQPAVLTGRDGLFSDQFGDEHKGTASSGAVTRVAVAGLLSL